MNPAFIFRRHFKLHSMLGFLLTVRLIAALPAMSQIHQGGTVEGYITALHPPDGLDVNRVYLTTNALTVYGRIGGPKPNTDDPIRDELGIGTYVRVLESAGSSGKTMVASVVLVRDDRNKPLEGFGLIDKVISATSEPLLQADGYRIRVTGDTKVSFHGDLKSIAEVGTNTWVKYAGKYDESGLLIATRAEFYSARHQKSPTDQQSLALARMMQTYLEPGAGIRQDSLIDGDGRIASMHTKVRYGDFNGYCTWHKIPADEALQERVRRVGMNVIPAFQRQLAEDDPQKISFRFYAVDESRIRSDIFCGRGLVLVPKQAVERLKNDDQLAAVLADGVAFELQMHSARLLAEYGDLLGIEIAGVVASEWVPGVDLATYVGASVVKHEIWLRMQEQRGRMVLAMMAEAGYDPWQAPDAWRLLEAKHLPGDLGTLQYPSRSGYQLGILNLEYRRFNKASQSTPEGSSSISIQP